MPRHPNEDPVRKCFPRLKILDNLLMFTIGVIDINMLTNGWFGPDFQVLHISVFLRTVKSAQFQAKTIKLFESLIIFNI